MRTPWSTQVRPLRAVPASLEQGEASEAKLAERKDPVHGEGGRAGEGRRGEGATPLPAPKTLSYFFCIHMEFVDNVTPSSASSFYDSMKAIDNKKNWSDERFQAANNWATMYYQNAYNTAMMNYMNEYNKPINQMLRYQEAGISPWMVAGQANPGNMSSASPGAAPKGAFVAPSSVQKQAAAVQTLNSIQQVVGAASQLYDYISYGGPTHRQQLENLGIQSNILQQQLSRYQSEADWALYWNYGPGMGPNSLYVENSPRAAYMENSSDRLEAQIAQINALISTIYPSQAQANEARAALQAYQKQILEGQYGAPLALDTGNHIADSVLQMLIFKLLNTNLSFGFSGKMF